MAFQQQYNQFPYNSSSSVSAEDLYPSSIASTLVFGTPTLITDNIISPSSIASTLAFGTPSTSIDISPSGIGSTLLFGVPRLSIDISPTSIVSTFASGTPVIALADSVEPTSIASTLALGTPSIVAHTYEIPFFKRRKKPQHGGRQGDRTLVNVQGDYEAESGDSFIKNKPVKQVYIHLGKDTAQNLGGANGTVHYVEWEVETYKDDEYSFTSANPTRIVVNKDGRYSLYAVVGITQGGGGRTTFMSSYRVNGTTSVIKGRQRNYSRGSNYGDTSNFINTEIELKAGDYIEFVITVDDTDGVYTSNSINAECELILRRIK